MADSEQALHDEMVFGPSTSFGVDKRRCELVVREEKHLRVSILCISR